MVTQVCMIPADKPVPAENLCKRIFCLRCAHRHQTVVRPAAFLRGVCLSMIALRSAHICLSGVQQTADGAGDP